MTPQERELLSNLFDRLRQCEGNPKEPEAAAFIADAVARQPAAPYFMAQLLLVQDQVLSAAQARIRALEQPAEATEKAAQQTPAPAVSRTSSIATTAATSLRSTSNRSAPTSKSGWYFPCRASRVAAGGSNVFSGRSTSGA